MSAGGSATADHFAVPDTAAFSPAGRSLAVGIPRIGLKVYEIEPNNDNKAYKCHNQSNLTNVKRLHWSPITGHVVGVRGDGSIFKWLPHEPVVKVFQDLATNVRCSPNSQLYVVSYTDGTLTVRNSDDFSIVTSIFSPSVVADFAVSLDGRRIYDVRGSYCTIWEPASLTPRTSIGRIHHEASGLFGSTSNACLDSTESADIFEPITALAAGCITSAYCTGDSEGKVKIFQSDTICVHESCITELSVEHLAWSNDEKYLAVGDLGNWVRVLSVEFRGQGRCMTRLSLEFPVGESIQQFIFNKDSTELLVISAESFHHFNLGKNFLRTKVELPKKGYRWINHPCCDSLLLGFHPRGAIIAEWNNLRETTEFQFNKPLCELSGDETGARMAANQASSPFIKTLIVSQFESKVLLQICQSGFPSRKKDSYYITDCEEIVNKGLKYGRIHAIRVSKDIARILQTPIGIFHDQTLSPFTSSISTREGRLVFMDENAWICTALLKDLSTGCRIKRFFFLPRDWINTESLELMRLTEEGGILCPRNGEVALIRHGMDKEWSN